jgi:hypothetical protein
MVTFGHRKFHGTSEIFWKVRFEIRRVAMYFRKNDEISVGMNSGEGKVLGNEHLVAVLLEKVILHTDKFVGCGKFDIDKEGIYRLNFCGQEVILTFEGEEDIEVKEIGKVVYLGPAPQDLNIEYSIVESDDKIRDILKDAAYVADKLTPIASGAHPGAGAGVAAFSSLVKHIKMGVDDDEIAAVRIFSENVKLKNNSRIEIQNDEMVTQVFKVIDLGVNSNEYNQFSVRIKDLDLSGDFTDSKIEKIFDRFLSRKNMIFNFHGKSGKNNDVYSAQFRENITWKKFEIFKVVSPKNGKNASRRVIPLALTFSLNRKGVDAQYLLDLLMQGAGRVNQDIEIVGQNVNPAKIAGKIKKEEDSILKFITEFSEESIMLYAFNGAIVLCQNDPPESEENVLFIKKNYDDNRWEQRFFVDLSEDIDIDIDGVFDKQIFSKIKRRIKNIGDTEDKTFSFTLEIKELS